MNRNPKLQSRNETRYTSQNLPDSEEVAHAQIKKLQESIASIEEDLEVQSVQSFHDASEFETWKKRATTALKYKQRELRFLEAWLKARDEERQEEISERVRRELQEQIATLTEGYRQTYSPVFGVHRPATEPDEAKARITVVLALHNQIGVNLAQFREVASEHEVNLREQQGIAQPLQALATEINAELEYLKNVLRILSPETAYHEEERAQSEQEIAVAERAKQLADAISSERSSPYDEQNPPQSLEEARVRLDLVSELIKTLERKQQELADEWRIETNIGLSKWAKRPISQLRTSLSAEVGFLNRQIRHMKRQNQETNQAAPQRVDFTVISQGIREQANDLAKKIRENYTQAYTDEHPPQNTQEADERLRKLVETKRQLQTALSDVTAAWCSHPLRREDLISVKKPLVDILYEAEAEIAFLNAFLKGRQSAMMPGQLHWKAVCASALTRASFEGFELTAEERKVVTALLSEIKNASAAS